MKCNCFERYIATAIVSDVKISTFFTAQISKLLTTNSLKKLIKNLALSLGIRIL